ncbi:MAG: flagellar hook-length control protein FliK [Gammaproteobacteria bacterium]
MDIKPTLPPSPSPTVTVLGNLELKLNQIVEAKVIENQLALNTLTLKVADQTLTLRAEQPLNLKAAQSLQLLVVKLLPALELKVLTSPTDPQTLPTATPEIAAPLLKLVSQAINSSTGPKLQAPVSSALDKLAEGQRLLVKVTEIAQNKISLQLLPTSDTSDKLTLGGKTALSLSLDQLIPSASANTPNQTRNPSPLSGQILQLQVVRTGIKPLFSVTVAAPDAAETMAETLRQLLPAQDSPLPLLNQLPETLAKSGVDASVSETLKLIAQDILRHLPQAADLNDPVRLKQGFKDSGLFLESKLLELLNGKTPADLNPDFKAKLLKLVQILSHELANKAELGARTGVSLLDELLHKAQNALAKLTLDQINALPKEDSAKQSWAVEIPFYKNDKPDSVRIEIERDQSNSGETKEKNWAVSITITPPNLGTIRCRISCYDGSVNTRFQSDVTSTVELIDSHLDCLKKQLEDKGLTVGFMDAQTSQAFPLNNSKTPLMQLLNEKV